VFPVKLIVWIDAGTLRLLSTVAKEPVRGSASVGAKLTISMQLCPAKSEAELEVEVSCGQVELELRLKLVEILGLLPVVGTVKRSGALPLFATVKFFGLSELVAPIGVEAKARVGGFCAFISFAALLPLSAT
jgi:hypothetical protein